ncbi:MAG: type II toxin-antitoxin system death-on-curing family toxin [Nitrosopumilus sp.]|uniref:type II toxin-antitoxin system death-on-curing family toxin n=1 Tax=Nitrosopumilus sp. TaxID=2024843 RepID=UPI00243141C3|nr:type II toxin-antitoxin system death-on-curing family toxin [Nitrosopumilus sp.]MCV0367748.1 type II toxin-antitoxin system death-on-curing family toxin [Nitrosopumilus sp.]
MAPDKEIVMEIDEKFLIETNKKVLLREKKRTGKKVYIETVPQNLALVLPKVSEYGTSGNIEQDLIQKAAAIMAAIPWTQAFFDGNRRTSIVAAGTFLRDNGYELDISPEEENTKLREMLSEIKKHRRDLEPTIMRQLFLYISERMTKYESRA